MNTELSELIEQLSQPAAWPDPVEAVEVKQTHISAVFLAGETVYKLKKPVRLSFLDFSTVNLRRKVCEDEVRLNRRLAADVYLGVVPVTRDGDALRFEGTGAPVDWAVKMRRLPEEATLEERLLRGEVTPSDVEAIARRLSLFHTNAETSEHISSFGKRAAVERNVWENFEIAARHIGQTLSPSVEAHLRRLTRDALEKLGPLIEDRARRQVPRDTHGDLHLDHIYLFPDREAPHDLIAVDCIEFNERFRYSDPVSDMAFLAMDLQFHGRWDLAARFCSAYFQAAGDLDGEPLLSLYLSYRAAVRGKVDGLQLDEPEIPEENRQQALVRGRGHWLLALWNLAPPLERPCLILIGGLPGTGKSTLARELADRANFEIIRSDVVRKELAGIPPDTSAANAPSAGIYAPEWTKRTYAECLRLCEERLFEGKRVIVDATFVEESHRRLFLQAALRGSVPGLFLVCETTPEIIRTRLAARRRDASDADWKVYEQAAARWAAPTLETQSRLRTIDTVDTSTAIEAALRELRQEQLA